MLIKRKLMVPKDSRAGKILRNSTTAEHGRQT